jgi:hypothetical protein
MSMVDGSMREHEKLNNHAVCPLCVVVSGKEREKPGYDMIMRLSDVWNFGFRPFREDGGSVSSVRFRRFVVEIRTLSPKPQTELH